MVCDKTCVESPAIATNRRLAKDVRRQRGMKVKRALDEMSGRGDERLRRGDELGVFVEVRRSAESGLKSLTEVMWRDGKLAAVIDD